MARKASGRKRVLKSLRRAGITDEGSAEGGAGAMPMRGADFHVGAGPTNLTLMGTDMTQMMKKKMAAGAADDCSAKFVPFPDHGPS